MSPLFLLPLLFIGAAATASWPLDGSAFYAKSFVDVLRNAIEFKNDAYLDAAFSESFSLHDCRNGYKLYNRQEVLEMLKSNASTGLMSMKFESSHYTWDAQISYVVADPEGQYTIHNSSGIWQLTSGQSGRCKKNFLAPSTDSAEDIAKSFMASMSSNSQNKVKLAALISDSFVFDGCVSVYDKKMAVVAFSGSASELTINFESAKFVNGEDVEYVVDLIRHGVSHEAQFTLHKENGVYVLFRGKVLKCPSRHFARSW